MEEDSLRDQQLDEQLKALRAQVAEKEKQEMAKKANNDDLLRFVSLHGIKLSGKVQEQFNLPLYAIIYMLISLKPADKKLKALKGDTTLMYMLRTSLSSLEEGRATYPLLGPPGFVLSPELAGFLGKVLCYLAQAYPADLMDFLFAHERFFHLLLRNATDWKRPIAKPDENGNDLSTLTISHALHRLVLHDMEKGAFAAPKFLPLLTKFLDDAVVEEVEPGTILCAMSLALQASRALFREFQGRKAEEQYLENPPTSLISEPTIKRALRLLKNERDSAGVILPFLMFMAKLDCHCAKLGRQPTVAPVLYLESKFVEETKDPCPKDFYLYGTCGNLPLIVTELWVQVLLSFQYGKLSLHPPKLIPILLEASKIIGHTDAPAALRNQMGSLIKAFLPLCNPDLLMQLKLIDSLKRVIEMDLKICIPQAKEILGTLKGQTWMTKHDQDVVIVCLLELLKRDKERLGGKPLMEALDKDIVTQSERVSKSTVPTTAEKEVQAEARKKQAQDDVKEKEARLRVLEENRQKRLNAILEQMCEITQEQLKGKDGEFMKNNVNGVDPSGRTMLHVACLAGNLPVVEFLVRVAGINKNSLDIDRKTVRHFAEKNPSPGKRDAILGILKQHGFQ